MVVVDKCELGQLKPDLEMENECTGKCFSNCDDRGMLQLDQELVINKAGINSFYRIDKGAPFATGLYAQVKRCKSLKNNSFYAAKFCPRKRPGQSMDEECIENLHEIALLSQLKHPFIISFIDAFILEDCVVTIMELAPGGDLQTVIDADLVLLEKDASRYIFQLLEALKYLHERHVAHLDIKPQNLLLMGEFPTCEIKLCDFEISRVIKPGKEVKEILGTPDYVAPEILLYEPLSTSADMWSVGILCYVLLTGFSPFGGDTDQETFRNIVHEPIDFPDELFEDISPSAIDFIIKLAVKNAKLRPTPTQMEEHEWIKTFLPEIIPQVVVVCESEPEPVLTCTNTFMSHSGPKKRSPRRTMAGSSTASAASRRSSARFIIRSCKSAYDLNKMGGITKSREALIEKMKMASGDSSVDGNWKLRKNLSKSREQLWESKIQLSKSCEKINNNLPGSTRWASIANFPSLDLGASQESVISVVSTCTNIGSAALQKELLDWQQQSLDDLNPTPRLISISMPNTPPIPNFDLSSPVSNQESGINYNSNVTHPTPDFNYPSLVNVTNLEEETGDEDSASTSSQQLTAEQESQKTVAELIISFGGSRMVATGNANNKKLDLKNLFEPILEVDGSEEQTMSLGDCSDNNSTSGVSSIIATTPTTKEPKSAESGHFSMNSSSSSSNELLPESVKKVCENEVPNNRRSSRTLPHHHHHHPVKEEGTRMLKTASRSEAHTIRRGSASSPKLQEITSSLKGILKKSPEYLNGINSHHINGHLVVPHSNASSRRGSIPGNCTRLYDTHTISSLAKVPKKSILKNSQSNESKSNRSCSLDNTSSVPSSTNRKQSVERSCSKSPENITQAEDTERNKKSISPDTNAVVNKVKIIPKGLSPRERPSFILLDVKPRVRKPTITPTAPRQRTPLRQPIAPPPTKRAPPKPRTSIREQILRKKVAEKSGVPIDKLANVTLHIPIPRDRSNINGNSFNGTEKSPPSSPVEITRSTKLIPSTFKSELIIEPAAVAIKVFPPDPAILPKSPSLEEENNKNDKNNNNGSNDSLDSCNNEVFHSLVINTKAEPDSDIKSKPKPKSQSLRIKGSKLERSTWGVVCTGSIGRAMERFETGTIKGKKLRRGSVPFF